MGFLDPPGITRASSDTRYGSTSKLIAQAAPGLSALILPTYTGVVPTFATSASPNAATQITNGITLPYNTPQVTFLGGVMTPHKPFSFQFLRNNSNGATATMTIYQTEMDYYGGDLELIFGNAVSGATRFWVFEDDVPVTAASQTSSAASASSMFRYRITFSAVKQRRLRIYWINAFFGGITMGPTDSITPVPKTRPKFAFLGDSYIEGAGGTTPELTFAPAAARALNVECFMSGQGGTGYVAPGPGGQGKAIYGDAGRIGSIPVDASWVIVFGTLNDDGLTGIQAAATACYAAIAARAPNARLIIIGPESNGGTVSTNRAANRDAVKAACAASSNVAAFIDPNDPTGLLTTTAAWAATTAYVVGDQRVATGQVWTCHTAHTSGASFATTNWAPSSWIYGTGKSGSPAGYGNADIMVNADGVHLTSPAGNDFHVRLVFEAIRRVLIAN